MTNKILLLAAASVLTLGMGSAFAQSETHEFYAPRSNSAVVSTPAATGLNSGDTMQKLPANQPAWIQYSVGPVG